MPPTSTVISGAVRVSNCALSTKQRFGGNAVFALQVIAEAVRDGFEHGEGLDVGLFLRGVHASRRERNCDLVTGVLRRLLDAGATGQNDQVRQGDFFAAGLGAVERALDAFQSLQHLCQLGWLVDFPILLRRQANPGAVRAAALVGTTKRGRRRPGGGNQLRDRQTGSQDLVSSGRRCLAHRSVGDSQRGWGLAR